MAWKTKTRKVSKSTPILASLVMLALGFAGGYQVREQRIPPPAVSVADHSIQVRFSPKKGCQDMLINALLQAKKKVEVAIFDLTSDEVAKALIQLHEKGIWVRVVADNRQSKGKNSKLSLLHRKGITVRIAKCAGVMHHKICIIDDGKGGMLTGSFNYSYGAEHKNIENLLWIRSKALAKVYQQEWQQVWQNAKPYQP
ncbi:MAG: phospholipase D-like domain-containing protein [Bacteroidota bacterium]